MKDVYLQITMLIISFKESMKNNQLIGHTNICDPMRTSTHSRNKCFILFIDDYSKMTQIYFICEGHKFLKYSKNSKTILRKEWSLHKDIKE